MQDNVENIPSTELVTKIVGALWIEEVQSPKYDYIFDYTGRDGLKAGLQESMMPEEDYRSNFALFCLDIFQTFRDVTTVEERKGIIAQARGLGHSHAAHLANLLLYTDDKALISSPDAQKILRESLDFFMQEIAQDVKKYVNFYNFMPSTPDPLKITYFFVLYMYKNNFISDMYLLEKIMHSVLNDTKYNTDDPAFVDAMHLFKKGIAYSTTGYESFTNIYGQYGFYKIYKLTYRLVKCLKLDN